MLVTGLGLGGGGGRSSPGLRWPVTLGCYVLSEACEIMETWIGPQGTLSDSLGPAVSSFLTFLPETFSPSLDW